MIYLGVDPGLKGGWAVHHHGSLLAYPMPLAGGRIDLHDLAANWKNFTPYESLACVEKVGAMPKQGVSSTFTFGTGYGAILGILAALGIRCELVTPQAWKKLILAGTLKDKDASVAYCRRAFPTVSLIPPGCRKPSDGMSDAMCIAEFAARSYRSEGSTP